MPMFSKSDEAIRKLSQEQYRVTQENATEAPGTGEYLDTRNRESTSTLCRESRCSLRPTSSSPDAGGQALPSRFK